MRIGLNPNKDILHEETQFLHQVILPVYIPHQKDYYKESFEILRICIESLLKTIHDKTFISVVNNGSCDEVIEYLDTLFKDKKIHELIHTENIGKVNAIFKALAGNNIKLVTISDSDVLFLDNWQNESIAIFNAFPKAGVVGLVPQFRNFEYFCGNLIFDNLFSKNLKFTPVKNVASLQKFYESIGWGNDYNQDYLKLNLTIEKNLKTAVVGSGHFVATYKRVLFDEIKTYIGYKLGAISERYLDEKTIRKDLWRLTTNDNYAFHMGNHVEKWMYDELKNSAAEKSTALSFNGAENVKNENRILGFIKNTVFVRLFDKKSFRKIFYKFKGMPAEMAIKY